MSFEGLLNKFCTVQTRVQTVNTTSGEMVESWIDKASNIQCRLNPLSGTEYPAANTLLSKATHTLFISRFIVILLTDRVVVDSVNYNVLQVKNAGGQGHHWEVVLEVIE